MIDFEKEILRHLNGEDVPGLSWGAAMSEAIEYLSGNGYVTPRRGPLGINYKITDKGLEAIAMVKE